MKPILFFFHLRSGADLLVDEEGVRCSSLDEARALALRAAREIISEDVLAGELDLDQEIIVTSRGRIAASIAFSDAVGFRRPSSAARGAIGSGKGNGGTVGLMTPASNDRL